MNSLWDIFKPLSGAFEKDVRDGFNRSDPTKYRPGKILYQGFGRDYINREYVLSLDVEIKEEPKKLYIANKLATDLNHSVRVSPWGNGHHEIKMVDDAHLEEVFQLIQQRYELGKRGGVNVTQRNNN